MLLAEAIPAVPSASRMMAVSLVSLEVSPQKAGGALVASLMA